MYINKSGIKLIMQKIKPKEKQISKLSITSKLIKASKLHTKA